MARFARFGSASATVALVVAVVMSASLATRPLVAATVNLDTATPAVHIGADPNGLNNSIPLASHAGPVRVTAGGNARFGSKTGEQYNAAILAYRDHNGHAQYASIPMNVPGGVLVNG